MVFPRQTSAEHWTVRPVIHAVNPTMNKQYCKSCRDCFYKPEMNWGCIAGSCAASNVVSALHHEVVELCDIVLYKMEAALVQIGDFGSLGRAQPAVFASPLDRSLV